MDSTQTTSLVERALRMAYILRGGGPAGVLFHADRGTQDGFNRSTLLCLSSRVHRYAAALSARYGGPGSV